MRILCLILCIGLAAAYRHHTHNRALNTLYRWKQIDFAYPSDQEKQQAIANGQFNQTNVIPLGIERWRNRIFLSTPAWKKGVPVTLSTLPTSAGEASPQLTPYPSWDWHNAGNCTGFTSVFRMSVDHCGVMWVLDSGQVEAFEAPRQLCPPTLFAIDLDTDTVIGKYPIPKEFVLQNSLITNLVVDSRDSQCRDLHVYIADAWRFGLIVFRNSDSYYHAMSSSLEFVVSTSVLRDPSRVNNAVDEFKLLGESRGPGGQVSAAAIDRNGIMFFNLISQDSIGCWNTYTEYESRNWDIVASSNEILVFPNDLRIDHEVPQFAWIISNRLPMYQFNLIDPNQYNYRVLYLDPLEAVENTVCQPRLYSF
ncbi:PREDICTED: protein yellow-like [Papilio polytes]|uniref:protein yellow-like n=1 Tax=Papilio polytes TaxID=76194 RepID=UPI000676AED8|nr:PREDICTED: protein yellow-like [Papilio polytes]